MAAARSSNPRRQSRSCPPRAFSGRAVLLNADYASPELENSAPDRWGRREARALIPGAKGPDGATARRPPACRGRRLLSPPAGPQCGESLAQAALQAGQCAMRHAAPQWSLGAHRRTPCRRRACRLLVVHTEGGRRVHVRYAPALAAAVALLRAGAAVVATGSWGACGNGTQTTPEGSTSTAAAAAAAAALEQAWPHRHLGPPQAPLLLPSHSGRGDPGPLSRQHCRPCCRPCSRRRRGGSSGSSEIGAAAATALPLVSFPLAFQDIATLIIPSEPT